MRPLDYRLSCECMTFRSVSYSGLTLVAAAVLPAYFLGSERGRTRLRERYGFWGLESLPKLPLYWFHGASIGEINSLMPLIESIYHHGSQEKRILLTATSATGLDRVNADQIVKRLLPFDHSIFFASVLRRLQITSFVFGETELWPNLLAYLEERGIPAALVNARISERSQSGYHIMGDFLANRLRGLRAICCATEVARERFIALGAQADHVHVVGNAKFDIDPSLDSAAAAALKRQMFAHDGAVVVLGSLRPGEEALWFPVIAKFTSQNSKLKFIVAPRHSEKFEYFANRLLEFGIDFTRRSLAAAPSKAAVILLDSLGQLEKIYAFAALAFVGGTLVPIGGHSPIEAAAHGVALVSGPWRANIEEVMSDLERRRAVVSVSSETQIDQTLHRLENDPEHFAQLGDAARSVWQQNRGATKRTLDILRHSKVLPEESA